MTQGGSSGSARVTRHRLIVGICALPKYVAAHYVVVGIGITLAYLVAYHVLVSYVLSPDSLACNILSNAMFVALEAAVLGLCTVALHRYKGRRNRWVWAWLWIWMLFNLFGDSVWAYYEAIRQVEVPFPGLADIGYLGAYVVAFMGVLDMTARQFGRLRSLETTLDALVLTLGGTALAWTLVLARYLEGSSGWAYWVSLAWPIGDLLIILAFASFFLAFASSSRTRPPVYFLVILEAFLVQTFADAGYFLDTVGAQAYGPGSWMDSVWLLSFAIAGCAVLVGLRAREVPAEQAVTTARSAPPSRGRRAAGYVRVLLPYSGIPMIFGAIFLQLGSNRWRWDNTLLILACLGVSMAIVIMFRQYLTLAENRRLNAALATLSGELENKLTDLAGLNRRFEILNCHANHLNSLRKLDDVAAAGLELACSFEGAPGGWLTLCGDDGNETVAAIHGSVEESRLDEMEINAAELRLGFLRMVSLEIRGEKLGTMYLLAPNGSSPGRDLLTVIAAHVATAIDNAERYEEAVHLSEKDALTGLFNHRGIHKRLAGEALRAQQNDSELSLVMMDLDDFKMLNDTYGHPAGDSVLKQVADVVRAILRHADLAGRVGGDELLLVLPNTGVDGAILLSERLRESLVARPFMTNDGYPIPVSLSLGVATYPADAQSLGELLETADANLYASKKRGGNAVTGSPERRETSIDAGGLLGIAGKLLDVVGSRDHYTRKHSEDVIVYALALGEALGLSETDLDTLHVAAMMHDVGKIGVSGKLLRKPGPLNVGEEDMVRRHADMSAAVINDMSRLAEVANLVRAHHEHHDGSGYPAEAAGDEIPLMARILAVADTYSAMTLDRPYRKSLTPEQARTELERAAGTQLDPELVKAFLDIIDPQTTPAAVAQAEAV